MKIKYSKSGSLSFFDNYSLKIEIDESTESGDISARNDVHPLSEMEVSEILESLKNVRIDFNPKCFYGLDGETYTLKVTWDSSDYIKVSWWSDAAGESWKTLFAFRDILEKLNQKYFKVDFE